MSAPFGVLNTFIGAILIAVIFQTAFAASADSANAGTELVSGSTLPFELKSPSAGDVEDFQRAWRSALLAVRDRRYNQAMNYLRAPRPTERLAQVYRAIFFAEAGLAGGNRRAADSALEATLRWTRGNVWQRQLYSLRLQAFDVKTASPGAVRRFCLQGLRAPLEPAMKANFLYRLLALDDAHLPGPERMNGVRQLLDIASPDSRMETVYREWAARFPPGQGTWEQQKLLLDFEEKLGYTQKAMERAFDLLATAPGKVERQAIELKLAGLSYRKGDYSRAMQLYRKYEELYGGTPEVLLQLARVSRKLSNEPQAQLWYSRLVERFPLNSKADDVYWMRAFDAETEGRTEEAVENYTRLIAEFPSDPQAEKAMFRIGLAYYKRGDLDAAARAFQDLRRLRPSSRVIPAALYWEAKLAENRGDTTGALRVLRETATRFPFSFYGHLARFTLRSRGAWPENLEWNARFSSSQAGDVKSWLSSYASGYREPIDRSGESEYLPLSLLMEWRMHNLAVWTLQSQPSAFLSNPWALYVAARRCQDAGLWNEAYRFGSLLGNVLPIEEWAKAPRSVLRLLYPPAYRTTVLTWAARSGIPDGLVFGLMKQESGFDAQAVSRAGARGLMQMMPATGATQAKREGLRNFNTEGLFDPGINARLGIAYLRDVQRRYNGNLYLTLAHYNAGPEALANWIPRMADRPPDEAVEDIGFSETRDYVKRVLANYWTYQALYD